MPLLRGARGPNSCPNRKRKIISINLLSAVCMRGIGRCGREARTKMNGHILSGDYKPLIQYAAQGRAFELAIPTPEHYLPLLYTLALREKDEKISLFNDKAVGGSLAMTSVRVG